MEATLCTLITKTSSIFRRRPYVAIGTSIYVAAITFAILRDHRKRRVRTKLRGPSWRVANGWAKEEEAETTATDTNSETTKWDPYEDTWTDFEDWADKYGLVYNYPVALREKTIVVCDPKAIASILAKDTTTYHQHVIVASSFEADLGKVLLVAEEDNHRRQRRALSAGFSIGQIRNLLPVFYEFTHEVKKAWNGFIDVRGEDTMVEVQSWLNSIALDSIGKGGFAHDFGATKGYHCEIFNILESFGNQKPTKTQMFLFMLTGLFPSLVRFPTDRRKAMQRLAANFEELATALLEKARHEKSTGVNEDIDKSIIGALLRSETGSNNIRMDLDEIKAQINILMLAGYETTGIALTWALIELSRNPWAQTKLREELRQLGEEDATFDQLNSDLPYLDAVICEVLRLNPSLQELSRTAQSDDILPLSEPITDASGNTVHEIVVAKGDTVHIPVIAVNRSKYFWGEAAHEFKPDRWIEDRISVEKAAKIQGYRHLLTFGDGSRACLGRLFALIEIKAVLSTLIRNFTFELPDQERPYFSYHIGLLIRPKVAGQPNAHIPLRIKKVQA